MKNSSFKIDEMNVSQTIKKEFLSIQVPSRIPPVVCLLIMVTYLTGGASGKMREIHIFLIFVSEAASMMRSIGMDEKGCAAAESDGCTAFFKTNEDTA
ncbi:hypothetical protein [Selenomonas sp.]|uniref:hypothetical protein n=1 Tax=Selenomonas sp. TaxID=2053611 RepID=UPI003FA22FB7